MGAHARTAGSAPLVDSGDWNMKSIKSMKNMKNGGATAEQCKAKKLSSKAVAGAPFKKET